MGIPQKFWQQPQLRPAAAAAVAPRLPRCRRGGAAAAAGLRRWQNMQWRRLREKFRTFRVFFEVSCSSLAVFPLPVGGDRLTLRPYTYSRSVFRQRLSIPTPSLSFPTLQKRPKVSENVRKRSKTFENVRKSPKTLKNVRIFSRSRRHRGFCRRRSRRSRRPNNFGRKKHLNTFGCYTPFGPIRRQQSKAIKHRKRSQATKAKASQTAKRSKASNLP